jgi:hypothetical protein
MVDMQGVVAEAKHSWTIDEERKQQQQHQQQQQRGLMVTGEWWKGV